MKIKIDLRNSQKTIAINEKTLIRLAEQVLRQKRILQAELSIFFVGQRRMQQLNKKFRGIDRPTDVLAFCMREGPDAQLHPEVLGDIVICPLVTRRFAKTYHTTFNKELYRDLIHGILHLLGHDDTNGKSRQKMEKEQAALLKRLTERR